MNIANIIGLE